MGEFIHKLVQELKVISAPLIFEPWKKLSPAQLKEIGYCASMINHSRASALQESTYLILNSVGTQIILSLKHIFY